MQTMVRAVSRVELLRGFIHWASAKLILTGLHEDDGRHFCMGKNLGHAICSYISGILSDMGQSEDDIFKPIYHVRIS